MKRTKTGTENGFRAVKDGTWEPVRQHLDVKSTMFQFNKMKKKGRKRH